MKFDMHTHTNASDGFLNREQLLEFAALQGLSHIAITDHDTMANSCASPGDPVEVVRGVELSCDDAETGRKVHMLCYLPKDTAPLEPFFERAKAARNRAGERMVAIAAKYYPVITMERVWAHAEPGGVIFKQHIMNVLIDYGYTNELYGEIFQFLFGSKTGVCAAADPKYSDVESGIEAIRASRGVFVMAHPSVYDTMGLTRRLARAGLLDGIEIDHPRNKEADKEELRALCAEIGLLATAGSDYHARNSSRQVVAGEYAAAPGALERLLEISNNK